MPNINIQLSTVPSFLGILGVLIGVLLILGGTGVISPPVVQVVPGRKTWIAGTILTIFGVILLIMPEIIAPPRTPPTAYPTEAPSQPMPATPIPLTPQQPTQTLPTAAPQLSRCDWLAVNFPQTPEAIAAQFGLPIERIAMVREGCGETANGFVVMLGPPIQLTVPTTTGGCIDAPQDAVFSDQVVPDTAGGFRAFSGTVRSAILTYRPWC